MCGMVDFTCSKKRPEQFLQEDKKCYIANLLLMDETDPRGLLNKGFSQDSV